MPVVTPGDATLLGEIVNSLMAVRNGIRNVPMTRRALPRVVLLPAIRPARWSLFRGFWRPGQLSEFLVAADRQGLRFTSFASQEWRSDPRGPVVLVFECWDSHFLREAWPRLVDLDGTCAVAVRSAVMGQRRHHLMNDGPRIPSWSDLRELTRLGVDVVSAGHEGYDLVSLPSEVAFGELLRSKCETERRVGVTPRALLYPYDRVDARVAAVCRDAGFEFGLVRRANVEGDPHRCPVLRPRAWESPASFVRRILSVASDGRDPGHPVTEAEAKA
jgi:hypothetical protein